MYQLIRRTFEGPGDLENHIWTYLNGSRRDSVNIDIQHKAQPAGALPHKMWVLFFRTGASLVQCLGCTRHHDVAATKLMFLRWTKGAPSLAQKGSTSVYTSTSCASCWRAPTRNDHIEMKTTLLREQTNSTWGTTPSLESYAHAHDVREGKYYYNVPCPRVRGSYWHYCQCSMWSTPDQLCSRAVLQRPALSFHSTADACYIFQKAVTFLQAQSHCVVSTRTTTFGHVSNAVRCEADQHTCMLVEMLASNFSYPLSITKGEEHEAIR